MNSKEMTKFCWFPIKLERSISAEIFSHECSMFGTVDVNVLRGKDINEKPKR